MRESWFRTKLSYETVLWSVPLTTYGFHRFVGVRPTKYERNTS